MKLHPIVASLVAIQNFGLTSPTTFEQFKASLQEAITNSKVTLFFQPEAHITNGTGILKFTTWPFEISPRIQPIAISIQRPWTDIAITSMESTFWADMFFYLYSPITIYNLKFLPVAEKKSCTIAEFAEKVRTDIAGSLNAKLVDASAADLKEWKKRFLVELQNARMRQNASVGAEMNRMMYVNPELNRMTMQVKEVFPRVPYIVIYRDLGKYESCKIY